MGLRARALNHQATLPHPCQAEKVPGLRYHIRKKPMFVGWGKHQISPKLTGTGFLGWWGVVLTPLEEGLLCWSSEGAGSAPGAA